jgi:transposase
MVTWIGLDISKDTIDVGFIMDDKTTHYKIKNDIGGFQKLIKNTPSNSNFVMEATGVYYLSCARFLNSMNKFVAVENPLKIKRFSEMSLRRSKNDKKDALLIARYGNNTNPHRWIEPSENQLKSQEIQSVIDQYTTTIRRFKNQIHAFSNSGLDNKSLIRSLKKTIQDMVKSKVLLLESTIHQQSHKKSDPPSDMTTLP